MTRKIFILAAAVCAFSTSPVLAQQGTGDTISDRDQRSLMWLKGRQICDKARADSRLTDTQRLKICENILSQASAREQAAETKPRDGFERNFYWLGVSGIHTELMGLTGKIDKVRSKRSCEHALAAKAAKSNIVPSHWPQKYRAMLKPDPTETAVIAACRKEFPTLE